MRNIKHVFGVIVIVYQLFISTILMAQIEAGSTNFRSPLDISLIVAGNFGEVRSNHFHTGMDFKTMGVEGKNIYAVEDGYVSRIAFSHYGYGRALYITHPNGYTSVYAHLKKFKKPISDFVKKYQYSIQEETFNVYLDSSEIKVRQGQIVALSGNSGSSSAPHLHFEIRETDSENPMNPLLFGYEISDYKKPMINNLKIFPLDDNSLVNGKHNNKIIPIKKNKKGIYYINQELTGYRNLGFAIHSTDRLNARNICGLYSLDFKVNGESRFSHKMNKLDFSTNRYVNHHVDYLRHKRNNQTYHKSFMKGNNLLDIYNDVDNGYVYIENDSIYDLSYTAKDFSGNTSSFYFKVKGDDTEKTTKYEERESCMERFKHKESNLFDTTNFYLLMAENTLYEDLCFNYGVEKDSNYLSDIHLLAFDYIGVHQYYKIAIVPNQELDSNLFSKLLIVAIDNKGRMSDKGGDFMDGKVTTRVREFGKFAIAIDTTIPVVILDDKQNVNALKSTSLVSFTIGDDLSGIKSYSVFIDGEWILASYKRKKRKLVIPLSEKKRLTKGFHDLEIKVVDERENLNREMIKIFVH